MNKDQVLRRMRCYQKQGTGGFRRCAEFPEFTLADKQEPIPKQISDSLEGSDKVSGDGVAKSSAASEILSKYFSYRCISPFGQSPLFAQGTISMCMHLTKMVISGCKPSKTLSSDN